MNGMANHVTGLIYGQPPYEDHHGGGLWLKDAQGWFLVRNLVGMEWSSQFCADPAKVDLIRQNARRLYAASPKRPRSSDFQLWVTDQQGNPAAVAPVSPRGSGDGRVRVLFATPGSDLAGQVHQSEAQSKPLILDPSHPLAQQAFAQQSAAQTPAQADGS
jgi:hypothetical protein